MNKLKVISVKKAVAEDGAEYLSVKLRDAANPFANAVTRNFRQTGTKEDGFKWTIDPDAITVGLEVEGSIESYEVEPYSILDSKGEAVREANTFTCAIFKHEKNKIASTLKSMGKTLKTEATPEPAMATAGDDLPM